MQYTAPQVNGQASHPAAAVTTSLDAPHVGTGAGQSGAAALKGNRAVDVPGTMEDEHEEYCRYGV